VQSLYDTDFYAWALEQARRVRAGEPIDAEHVAEELESLGKAEERDLEGRLIILLTHKLKWEFQPSGRSASWRGIIRLQQHEIARHLSKNPSLRPLVEQAIVDVYSIAVIHAAEETRVLVEADFPSRCPYGYEEIMQEPGD
jgi:hypothetical protein